MKYVALCIALCSLNTIASESANSAQKVDISNRSDETLTVYFERPNDYHDHAQIKSKNLNSVVTKTPSQQSPQSVFLHWNSHNKQKKLMLENSDSNKITVRPALAITINGKGAGIILAESSSSSSSSSSSED